VDRLHHQGVTEHEVDPLGGAEVRQPVPGEDALDRHHEALAVGLDQGEKVGRARPQVSVDEDLAVVVENADVHALGVQIDPAPMLVRSVVNSHRSPSCADSRVA
jgi:hypothetical protein